MDTIKIVPKFLNYRTFSVPRSLKWRKGKFGVVFPLDASNFIFKAVVD